MVWIWIFRSTGAELSANGVVVWWKVCGSFAMTVVGLVVLEAGAGRCTVCD